MLPCTFSARCWLVGVEKASHPLSSYCLVGFWGNSWGMTQKGTAIRCHQLGEEMSAGFGCAFVGVPLTFNSPVTSVMGMVSEPSHCSQFVHHISGPCVLMHSWSLSHQCSWHILSQRWRIELQTDISFWFFCFKVIKMQSSMRQ